MAERFQRKCRRAQCKALTRNKSGYCNDCTIQRARSDKRLPFYGSGVWVKLRAVQLAHHPLCCECGHVANTVDHIKPISLGGESLDLSNLQSLCESCHNRKRQRESRGL